MSVRKLWPEQFPQNWLVVAASDYDALAARVSFHGIGKLKPLDDITPREAVQICSMLACGSVGSGVDYAKFVKENSLQRHFEQPDTRGKP